MNEFEEEKKPKRFNKRVKKNIAIGVLTVSALTAATVCAIQFSSQEQPGKVRAVNFQWESFNLNDKKNIEQNQNKARKALVREFCLALLDYQKELQEALDDPKTNWSNVKSTSFSIGGSIVGGIETIASTKEEAVAALKEIEGYLANGNGPGSTNKKLNTHFHNENLKRTLDDLKEELKNHDIPVYENE
ncbi:hypothetical protein [Mycoplasma todarodis]|uniref:Uncharacterized protein n=1 Tax=Mycoplasma todarodis TaxID=1937191 RepID=A0A4R0XRU7_9MOLU|nr:hypothetical protein [Mycoplasma todarodis]TCG11605.1 hypothetical protein C4B25_01335 [Mycoplasma todarodis]